MTAKIIHFPKPMVQFRPLPDILPEPFTAQWQDQHAPLIDAALELLQIDDDEFERRCRQMQDANGRSLLDELSAQLDRLGSHVGDVVQALAMTAMRIRTTMAGLEGQSA